MRTSDRKLVADLGEIARALADAKQRAVLHASMQRLRDLGKRDVQITKVPPIATQGGTSIPPAAVPTGPTIPARAELHAGGRHDR